MVTPLDSYDPDQNKYSSLGLWEILHVKQEKVKEDEEFLGHMNIVLDLNHEIMC